MLLKDLSIMHVIIPLLFVLIALNSKQLKTDKLYRANVFSLVGISYFVLLQYTIYWYRIFPYESWAQLIPGVVVVLTTVAIALSPWTRKSHPIKTIVLGGLFAVALSVSFLFDFQVKEKLAELGGYFTKGEFAKSFQPEERGFQSVAIRMIGIELATPRSWEQRALDSEHWFFTYRRDGNPLLELRPNCLGDFDIDTPTYINNVLASAGERTQGSNSVDCRISGVIKECLVKVNSPFAGVEEKWTWFKIPNDRSQSVVVDVLFYDSQSSLRADVWQVLSSVRPLPNPALGACRTPAAWL